MDKIDKTWETIINYCCSYEVGERETQLPIMLEFLKKHFSITEKHSPYENN